MTLQQQETEEATLITDYAAALAEGSAAGTAVAKPFVTRKLGSFEKMLTQTRDGVGPAEEGIRTLLTPHVWVSILGGRRLRLSNGIESVQPTCVVGSCRKNGVLFLCFYEFKQ